MTWVTWTQIRLKDIATHSHFGHTDCRQTGTLLWARSFNCPSPQCATPIPQAISNLRNVPC